MIEVGKRLCKLITTYTPVITQLFPDNEELLAALAAANTACAALTAALSAVREYGD
jgi:hypothetical protein